LHWQGFCHHEGHCMLQFADNFYWYHFFLSFMNLLLVTLASFSPLAIAFGVTLGDG